MKTPKKFAMMLMGSGSNAKKDYVVMQTESTETHIFTVNTPEQAVELAGQLAQQGFGAIEVCGAFGKELAERMFHATGERVSVGSVACPQEQKKGAVRPILESAVTLDSCCRYIIGRKTPKTTESGRAFSSYI